MRPRALLLTIGLFVAVLVIGGCGKHEKPNFTYMPDMDYSPALKAQEKGAMRKPVEGTIPRGFEDYPYPDRPDLAAKMRNPLPRTMKNLKRGQEYYNIYCMVCHGKYGEGDGSVVPPFTKPPSLGGERARGWTDGQIYHVITVGQNNMPSYALQVAPENRWAIIHYVRTLQRALQPSKSDLEKLKKW